MRRRQRHVVALEVPLDPAVDPTHRWSRRREQIDDRLRGRITRGLLRDLRRGAGGIGLVLVHAHLGGLAIDLGEPVFRRARELLGLRAVRGRTSLVRRGIVLRGGSRGLRRLGTHERGLGLGPGTRDLGLRCFDLRARTRGDVERGGRFRAGLRRILARGVGGAPGYALCAYGLRNHSPVPQAG